MTHLHLAALGLVLLQLPIPPEVRAPALLVCAWILPATTSAVPHLGPVIEAAFNAGTHLGLARIANGFSPPHILPIAGLALAAWMLEAPTAPEGLAPVQARAK
jgi:hypothetical protein